MKAFNKTIVAIIAILILETIALLMGFDGAALAASCALIAGLGGYAAPHKKPPP